MRGRRSGSSEAKRGITVPVAEQQDMNYSTTQLYSQVAFGYSGLKEHKKAIELLIAGLQLTPTASDLLSQVGWAYLADKQYPRAKLAFDTSLKYIPDYKQAKEGLKELDKLYKADQAKKSGKGSKKSSEASSTDSTQASSRRPHRSPQP